MGLFQLFAMCVCSIYGRSKGIIGRGAFGVVNKHDHSGSQFAIKSVEGDWSEREREICEFLSKNSHINIVTIVEVHSCADNLVIVMEYISKSLRDVLNRMNSMNKRLKHIYCVKVLKGLASGLEFLHSCGLVHRDIKPENVLILMSSYTTKICDFGTCKFLGAVNITYVCTRFYRAPEQILDCRYGFSADLWAFGCITCEIASGRAFFRGENNVSQLCAIINKIGMMSRQDLMNMGVKDFTKFEHIPDVKAKAWESLFSVEYHGKAINTSYGNTFEDFVSRILTWNPSKRLSAAQCLDHPFLKDLESALPLS